MWEPSGPLRTCPFIRPGGPPGPLHLSSWSLPRSGFCPHCVPTGDLHCRVSPILLPFGSLPQQAPQREEGKRGLVTHCDCFLTAAATGHWVLGQRSLPKGGPSMDGPSMRLLPDSYSHSLVPPGLTGSTHCQHPCEEPLSKPATSRADLSAPYSTAMLTKCYECVPPLPSRDRHLQGLCQSWVTL